MPKEPLPRLDTHSDLKRRLGPFCRLRVGEIWQDPVRGHRVGVLDAAERSDVERLTAGECARLAVNDPPYNVTVGRRGSGNLRKLRLEEYIDFSVKWVGNAVAVLADDAHFYVWVGADQNDGFEPLADLMFALRPIDALTARSFITVRNQRGYGTQKNWMAVRQELLYYVKGAPPFNVVYTDIPKILRGYYKDVGGRKTENLERSRSRTIRPGNVWVDIQQVFYRMEENVPGAYAQKPLKAIERIVSSSSAEGDLVLDLFAHSGTTLLACERLGRGCLTMDVDPVFAELTIRRLERWRTTGKTGWQCEHPFPELPAT